VAFISPDVAWRIDEKMLGRDSGKREVEKEELLVATVIRKKA
jgi:hypothetical protein